MGQSLRQSSKNSTARSTGSWPATHRKQAPTPRCPRLDHDPLMERGPLTKTSPSPMPALSPDTRLTAAALESYWRPTRDRLVQQDQAEDLRIRIHRACAALHQAELVESDQSRAGQDAALVFRWVSLNALYGDWDYDRGMPTGDRRALDRFTSTICRVDEAGRITRSLQRHTAEARALVESPFLIERFWSDGEWDQVRPRRGRARRFQEDLDAQRPSAALQQVLIAVYFLRCQIIHGGATVGSTMNRVTVDPASKLLKSLCGAIIAVSMERGLEMTWGELCYPPVRRGDHA